jgi:DNA-binding response OmpR family regulator
MKVLICDSDSITVRALEFQFTKDGFEVLKAANGRDAQKTITASNDIDVLITDIYMPYMTGLELIAYVRKMLKLDIPIVVISRVNLEETVLQALELGANSYLTKPFDSEAIVNKVKYLMRHD